MRRDLTVNQMTYLYRVRMNALMEVARVLGPEHPLVEMMGSLAWGRHEFEGGPDDKGVKFEAARLGYIIGRYDTLNIWASRHDREAQRVLREHWVTSWYVPENIR